MRLEKTRLVFEESKKVVTGNTSESELVASYLVASYLAEYILIIFYAEMEEKIDKIIGNFIKKHSNSGISEFLCNLFKNRFKHIDKQKLRETLKLFGKHKGNRFDKLVKNSDSADSVFSKYSNFIEARHSIAHSGVSKNISWNEASEVADIGEKILEIFEDSLNFEPPQANR